MSFKKIKVGELGNKGNNTEVIKELFEVKPNDEPLDDMISGLDTKIKGDFFQ